MNVCSTSPARRGRFALVLLALAALPALAAPPSDSAAQARQRLEAAADGDVAGLVAALPGLPPPWTTLAQARIAAARLDEDRALALAGTFLAEHGQADCDAALAQSVIADAAFASARYARAATAAQARATRLARCDGSAEEIEGATMMATLAARLATAPAQRVAGFLPAAVAYARDRAGLPRAQARINGHAQQVVLDTGANLSVVSASTAARLGLRMLGEAGVGSSSRQQVAVRVAMADRLELAGLALEHVAFLVLDDAQLEMPLPGGYRIEAIVGFPVFRAMRRVRFGHDGRLVPEPGAGDADAPRNLALAGSDLFVDARVGGVAVPLHLDSGAGATSLSPRFAEAHPQLLHGLAESRQRLAGAGGATERAVVTWPQVEVEAGGRTTVLPALPVALRDSDDVRMRSQGVLGGDVLNAFDAWTLDFEHMRLELGAPLAADATR
ncbi:retropepsin-like aspartic protease [Xanthomonas massiliensis]|uniref:retropepsin-like aspartic protease n=1 Tax=Xanthomonas massiliensis TaxID=1720302 RepID=UPI0008246309|nr:retropepsin-like aspartic protease [Xanthomonas massiliensis]